MPKEAENENFRIKDLPKLLWKTALAWKDSDPFRHSAVVAYYAVLSLPALLIIIINIVGAIWGEEIVRGKITGEISATMGPDVAESIQSMFKHAREEDRSIISSILGICILLYGSTGVFYQLQQSLNSVWQLKLNEKTGFLKILTDRAKSFGFILVIGFLLLISFIVTAGISILSEFILSVFPETILYLIQAVDIAVSLSIISLLFALIFKFLPDAEISWRSVIPGALITSALFVIGKFLLGVYFGKADPGSAYGAAGSIVLILLWVSYSCLILFFGAQFTRVYSSNYGLGVRPSDHAVKVDDQPM